MIVTIRDNKDCISLLLYSYSKRVGGPPKAYNNGKDRVEEHGRLSPIAAASSSPNVMSCNHLSVKSKVPDSTKNSDGFSTWF